MLSSMHICASPKQLSTSTTTFIPLQSSAPRFPSPLSSTPVTITRTPFSYHSDHRTPSIQVPISNVRDKEKEHEQMNEDIQIADDQSPKPQTTTTTRPPTQAHDSTSTATSQLDAYALPPPDTYPRFVPKTSNIEYINEDTTDSESISDVGHHLQFLPPRIYFPESLITYVPPYCSDLIARDPDVKGVPRNYRSWARAGRPRLEVEGATRSDAKNDFSSMGLVWHGNGGVDGESDSDMSDAKGDDKDKRRRKKKKLAMRRNALPTLLMERPKRMVRRIAEADGQLRIIPGLGNTTSTTSGGVLDKPDRFDNSRAQSVARSSLPSSRAQSPAKRRKASIIFPFKSLASDRGAGAERKTEADTEAEDEEKDADGSEEEDIDADGEVDPDAIVFENEKRPINGIVQQQAGQSYARTTMRMEVPTANKALSESSSVTLIDTDADKEKSKDDGDMHMDRAARRPRRKRKRDDDKEVEKDVDNADAAPSPSKRRCARRRVESRQSEPKRDKTLIENLPTPSRTTRSTVPTVSRAQRNPSRRMGTSIIKSESTFSERIPVPSVETEVSEEDGETELEDDQDDTFIPGKQGSSSRIKQPRTPRTRSKPSKSVSNVENLQPSSSSRPARGTRAKRRESSPPHGFLDLANSSGSEAKDNAGSTTIAISRPHHRTAQSSQLVVPIPTRTFEPEISLIQGYSGFYRRYPLILQFDITNGTAEAGTPSKKASSFGDMEKYILDGVPSELITNSKRPLGNFNPPRDIRDLYTPRYTKGSGGKKLALCPICFEDPRRGGEGRQEWNHTKTSQHNYHMQYYHGISATRFQPFSPPLCHRVVQVPRPQSNEKSEILQGKCHHCKQWIALEGCKVGELKVKELFWWKHAAGCHKDSKFPGESDIFIEDEAYKRLLEYEAQHGIDPDATTAT